MCARPSSTRLAMLRSAYALARISSSSLETGGTLRRFAWRAATLARPAISGPAFNSPPGDGLSISPKRSPSGAPSDSYLQTQRAPRHIGSSPVVGSDADRPLGWARKRSDSCFQIFEVKRTSLIRRQEPRFKATRSHLALRKAQFDRGEAQ